MKTQFSRNLRAAIPELMSQAGFGADGGDDHGQLGDLQARRLLEGLFLLSKQRRRSDSAGAADYSCQMIS